MSIRSRRTKIVATLGPACHEPEQIVELVTSGADVLRCNTSHLTPELARELYERIEEVRPQFQKSVPILVDLQGPKLRLGAFSPRREVQVGEQVVLHEGGEASEADVIPVAIEGFEGQARPGQVMVLGDGTPTLKVESCEGGYVRASVLAGGSMRARMGVGFPSGTFDFSALTSQDRKHILVARDFADFFALSFVGGVEDIAELRIALLECESDARVIAKIERGEALTGLEGIMSVSDAVMVARGDLGVDIGLAHVPFAQRWILQTAQQGLTCAITATQVLESMIHSDQPTRAEVTDITGAIMDGTSALMLSEETAMGKHPALAVRTMAALISDIEAYLVRTPREVPKTSDARGSLVRAADQLGSDLGIEKLLIPTDTGETARYAAALAHQNIIALAPSARVRRQLAIERGVTSLPWDGEHGERLPATIVNEAMRWGWVEPNERVIVAWSEMQAGGLSQLIATLNLDRPLESPE